MNPLLEASTQGYTVIDLTEGEIEVAISEDKTKLWINVDGLCRFRAYNANVKVVQR